MVIFKHIDTKKTVGLNYKVLYSFFLKSDKFILLQKYPEEISPIFLEYFLIRHPLLKLISFYKNKLYDFYGFEFLSDELVEELSKLLETDLFLYKIKGPKVPKHLFEKIRSENFFLKFVENLSIYKHIDPHLYPQTKILNIFNYNKIIRVEKEISTLQIDFPDVDFKIKHNKSNYSEKVINFLNKNIEQEIYNQYNSDYIIGKYPLIFKGD